MADINIDKLKSVLGGGGARANYFEAQITGITDADTSVLIKAASMPASTIAPIAIPFRGRQLQVAGDRTFEPWTVTVINDSGMNLRGKFEAWMNDINSHVSNESSDDLANYMRDATVSQLDRKGEVVRTYEFKGLWPSNISAIDVSYDSENTVSEFTVEFQITYWTSADTDS